jgi:hypothetical protein
MVTLGQFMRENDMEISRVTNNGNSQSESSLTTGQLRILSPNDMESGRINVDTTLVEELTYTTSFIKKHKLTNECIVFPRLNKYYGVRRFIEVDDIPTRSGRQMAYIRCPNLITVIALNLWLNKKDVVAAIGEAHKGNRRLKLLDNEFLEAIPVPREYTQPEVIAKVIELDAQVQEHLQAVNSLLLELDTVVDTYAK